MRNCKNANSKYAISLNLAAHRHVPTHAVGDPGLREIVHTDVILEILRVRWGGSVLQLLTPDPANPANPQVHSAASGESADEFWETIFCAQALRFSNMTPPKAAQAHPHTHRSSQRHPKAAQEDPKTPQVEVFANRFKCHCGDISKNEKILIINGIEISKKWPDGDLPKNKIDVCAPRRISAFLDLGLW